MSTRCTIGYDNENFHLYEECFDNDKVYLELSGDCHEVVDSFYSKDSREITVGIDVSVWRKIVESWLNSHWGKTADKDHKKPEIADAPYINELFEGILRRQAKKEIQGE